MRSRALLAFDHRFIASGDSIWTVGSFPASYWTRYLSVFNELVVAGRKQDVPEKLFFDSLNLSSREKVNFKFFPSLSSPMEQLRNFRLASDQMAELVAAADVVITRLPSELGLLAIAQAQKQGKVWAVEVVGCAWDSLWNHGSWEGKVYAPLMMARMRRVIRRAPFALYVTKDFLQRRYPNRCGLTTWCSNVEIPSPAPSVRNERLHRVLRPASPLTLGLIGSLRTRYKGIQTVMEALAEARDQLPAVEFRILGGGDIAPWLQEAERFRVRDLVRFDGTRPSGDPVYQWLDDVDVYLQPSFTEGLPRALIEAMSRGCPAIASTVGGIPELLDPDCLVRPGDVLHLAQLLTRACSDADWRRAQADRNWVSARDYSDVQLAARRISFWRSVASAGVKQS